MMADMGMTMDMPWKAADVFFTFAMWVVMMAGMMMASAAPVMLLFAGMHRGRGAQHAPRVVFAFTAGYLLVWTAFSAGAALAQWALHQAAMLSPTMTTSSARLSGAILIAAGVYQLTPFKGACLTHCRSPLGFLMSHWREGTAGALRMGIDARYVLPGLLLGLDVRPLRRGRDESRMGGGDDVLRTRGKDRTGGRVRRSSGGRRDDRVRRSRLERKSLDQTSASLGDQDSAGA